MADAAQQLQAAAAAHAALQQHVDDTTEQLHAALERCVELEAQLAVQPPTVDSDAQVKVTTCDAHMQAVPKRGRPVLALVAMAMTAAAVAEQ
jgi:hypothetical protein